MALKLSPGNKKNDTFGLDNRIYLSYENSIKKPEWRGLRIIIFEFLRIATDFGYPDFDIDRSKVEYGFLLLQDSLEWSGARIITVV